MHHARIVLQQIDRMRGEFNHYGKSLKGHVRLLCNTSALSEYLPEILSAFLAQYPQISVDLEERPKYEIADAIRAGMADIGLVANSADLQGLEVYVFRPDPLVLIVVKDHELATRGPHESSGYLLLTLGHPEIWCCVPARLRNCLFMSRK